MTRNDARRAELHEFLRAARGRVDPADAGLTAAPNRRLGGLHQADVAALLQVSTRWYTAFENGSGQGRRPPAPDVLDRLAEVLGLTAAERVRLYLLAAGHEPPGGSADVTGKDADRAALERLVSLAGPDLPAMVTDIAWNIAGWNDALASKVLDPGALPSHDRNLVLWLFTPAAQEAIADIGAVREEEIGQVHLALARYPGDPQLAGIGRGALIRQTDQYMIRETVGLGIHEQVGVADRNIVYGTEDTGGQRPVRTELGMNQAPEIFATVSAERPVLPQKAPLDSRRQIVPGGEYRR